MESKGEIHALISAYLAGELSDEEQKLVEVRCEKDAEFAEEFRLQAQAEYIVYASAKDKKREELNQMFDLMQRHGELSRGSSGIKWVAGIAAAAVIAVLLFFFWPKPPQSPAELYAEYIYQKPSEPSSIREIKSGDDSVEVSNSTRIWGDATLAFNEKNYELSQQLISEILEDTAFVHRETAQYFLGLSYLYLIDPDKEEITITDHQRLQQAIQAFEKVDPMHLYKESAIWYTALAYLKMNDLPAARKALNKVIAFNTHFWEKEAQDLLNRIAE